MRTSNGHVVTQRVRRRLDASRQRQMREGLKVLQYRIAPPPGLAFLNRQKVFRLGETLLVDAPPNAVPFPLHPAHRVDASLIVQRELVPERAPGAQPFCPANVMKPKQR